MKYKSLTGGCRFGAFLFLIIVPQLIAETTTLLINSANQFTRIAFGSNDVLRVLSWPTAGSNTVLSFAILKPGAGGFDVRWSANLPTVVIRGPGEAVLQFLGNEMLPSACTVEITDVTAIAADKAVAIQSGQGARITLECSTDLVAWTVTAPGTFTNNLSTKFFRIHAERLPN
jgi:hypothetical protein